MPLAPLVRSAPSTTIAALVLVGCGATGTPAPQPATGETSTTEARQPETSRGGSPAPSQEDPVQIRITVGDQRLSATLAASAAARDLVAQLPVTVEMTDHGGVEKTGALPAPLSLEGQPDGADPAVGDLGYYAPGNDLVLYYGDQSSYPGIVVLGRLDGDAAERIAALDGSVTVTVEALR